LGKVGQKYKMYVSGVHTLFYHK